MKLLVLYFLSLFTMGPVRLLISWYLSSPWSILLSTIIQLRKGFRMYLINATYLPTYLPTNAGMDWN